MPENKLFTIGDDLALLSEAAGEAGKIAMRFYQRDPQVWMKEGNSPVSEADLAVDAYLKKTLLGARPHYGWISEETQDERPAYDYHRYFVVDPIDGTRGFIEGSDAWSISIAIIEKGRPTCGVLECPVVGEHFTVRQGEPALMNGKAIKIAQDGALSRPRVSCATALSRHLPANFQNSYELMPHIPSLAYRIALLASGRVDAVLVRTGCHDWDIAAADLIATQSGARLVDTKKRDVRYGVRPYRHGFLIAGGCQNIRAMLDIVREAGFR